MAHIACMVHGSVAAAHAAGAYRTSEPVLQAEANPLAWLEYSFLGKGKAIEAKIGHVTGVLRSLLKEAELRKVVVGHLGRNTLCTTLLSEDVSSYQTATLMGWSLGDKMQRSYASKTSISALPALEAAAGFAPGEAYHVPRAAVDPAVLCPNVYKLFVADWMVRLREQVVEGMAQNGVEFEGARDYLLAREHMMKVLLQNLPFYIFEYGAYFALFRLQAFWAIAGHDNGGWGAAASLHPLLDEFQIFAKEVLVAHYGENSLAELLNVQKTITDGNAFPVPCSLLNTDLPFASEDARQCGEAFVIATKASFGEAIDTLLKSPSKASRRHSELAAGTSSEQLQLVGEMREEIIKSQRQVIELQQQLLQRQPAPWYGQWPQAVYGQWPPAAAYAATLGGAPVVPVTDAAVLGGNGLSRLQVSLDNVHTFSELQARWPAVQRALASPSLDAGEREGAIKTVSVWQRVFRGVSRCFEGWQDQQVSEFMDGFRASYRPGNRRGAMPIKRYLEGVVYTLRDQETGKAVGGTLIGGQSSGCGTNAEFEAAFVQAAASFAAGKGLPVSGVFLNE